MLKSLTSTHDLQNNSNTNSLLPPTATTTISWDAPNTLLLTLLSSICAPRSFSVSFSKAYLNFRRRMLLHYHFYINSTIYLPKISVRNPTSNNQIITKYLYRISYKQTRETSLRQFGTSRRI